MMCADHQSGDRWQHHDAEATRLERLAELGTCAVCGCDASFRVAEGDRQGDALCTACADELFPFGMEETP